MLIFLNKVFFDVLYKFELYKYILFLLILKNKIIIVDFLLEFIKKLYKYNMFLNIYVLYI